MTHTRARRIVSEFVGSGFLVAAPSSVRESGTNGSRAAKCFRYQTISTRAFSFSVTEASRVGDYDFCIPRKDISRYSW